MHFVVLRAITPNSNVFLDRPIEQSRVLEDRSNRLAQRVLRHGARVHAINQNTTVSRRMNTLQHVDECGLAGTGRADDSDRLAGLNLERNVIQTRTGVREGKADILENDVAIDVAEIDKPLGLDSFGGSIFEFVE